MYVMYFTQATCSRAVDLLAIFMYSGTMDRLEQAKVDSSPSNHTKRGSGRYGEDSLQIYRNKPLGNRHAEARMAQILAYPWPPLIPASSVLQSCECFSVKISSARRIISNQLAVVFLPSAPITRA